VASSGPRSSAGRTSFPPISKRASAVSMPCTHGHALPLDARGQTS
jgi:hypothetical protein